MDITVNGELKKTAAGHKVADLLAELDLEPERVVVERNREIVPREQFGQVELKNGDNLEILHFVGGG